MKAKNDERLPNGHAVAYDDGAFEESEQASERRLMSKKAKAPKTKLKVEKREDGWWIVGEPLDFPNGPYATKDEANEDRAGLERFFDVEIHRKPRHAA